MRIIITLFVFSFLFSFAAWASGPEGGYRIEVQCQNYDGDTLKLGYYFGKSQYLKDTALVNQGKFVFEGDEPLEPGVYLLVIPPDNKFVHVLVAADLQRMEPSAERDRVAQRVKRWLAGYRPALLFDDTYHTNKSLVEAVGILEMLDAGVKLPRASFWRARAMAVIGTSLPRVARDYTTSTSMGATTVLSDPPKNPVSYHALTLAYLARATQILGRRTPIETRRLLVHMARGLVFLTAPDGDYAQWGR